MIQYIAESGPLVAGFTVYDDFFGFFSTDDQAVYKRSSDPGDIAGGHAVSVVGYNQSEGYWICKNSWGADFADDGFFRIAFGEVGIDNQMWAIDGVESRIIGAAGASFVANPADEAFVGTAERDTVDYRTSAAAVTVLLSDTDLYGVADQMDTRDALAGGHGGYAESDTYTSIENVFSSKFGDRIYGAEAGTKAYLGDGDDIFDNNEALTVVDSIAGGPGNDTIWSGAGRDIIRGEDGNDYVFGEYDDDFIDGGPGKDWLNGQDGNDTILGGNDNDVIIGEDGSDIVYAGLGADYVTGGDKSDWISGDGDNDTIVGDEGNDTIFGADGKDEVFGGSGTDSIAGGTGDDWLNGQGENDTIAGETGNDVLIGEDGNDVLDGGRGQDYLLAGAGNDTLRYRSAADSSASSGFDVVDGFDNPGPAQGDVIELRLIDPFPSTTQEEAFIWAGELSADPETAKAQQQWGAFWVFDHEWDNSTMVQGWTEGEGNWFQFWIFDGPNVKAADYTAEDFFL